MTEFEKKDLRWSYQIAVAMLVAAIFLFTADGWWSLGLSFLGFLSTAALFSLFDVRRGIDVQIRTDVEAAQFAEGQYWLLLRPFKWDHAFEIYTGVTAGSATSIRHEVLTLSAALGRAARNSGCDLRIVGGAASEHETRALVPKDWQKLVLSLIRNARLVVLVPSKQKGTMWECEKLLNEGDFARACILIPPKHWTRVFSQRIRNEVLDALDALEVDRYRAQIPDEGGLYRFDRREGRVTLLAFPHAESWAFFSSMLIPMDATTPPNPPAPAPPARASSHRGKDNSLI